MWFAGNAVTIPVHLRTVAWLALMDGGNSGGASFIAATVVDARRRGQGNRLGRCETFSRSRQKRRENRGHGSRPEMRHQNNRGTECGARQLRLPAPALGSKMAVKGVADIGLRGSHPLLCGTIACQIVGETFCI